MLVYKAKYENNETKEIITKNVKDQFSYMWTYAKAERETPEGYTLKSLNLVNEMPYGTPVKTIGTINHLNH